MKPDPEFFKTPWWFYVAAACGIAFWLAVLYVAAHFVAKWW